MTLVISSGWHGQRGTTGDGSSLLPFNHRKALCLHAVAEVPNTWLKKIVKASVLCLGRWLRHHELVAVTGIQVYELMSGKKLMTMKGHFGDTICCIASPHEPRVFSGGADRTIHIWSPPPCGIIMPAPHEPIAMKEVQLPTSSSPLGGWRGGSEALSSASAQVEDRDAWSDEEPQEPPSIGVFGVGHRPSKRRRAR